MKIYIFTFFLILNTNCFKISAQKALEFTIPFGINWRTTTINTDFNSSLNKDPLIPFIGGWNTEVFSLNLGVNFLHKKSKIAFEYYPNLRYNYIHNYIDKLSTKSTKSGVYEFIVDHQLRLFKYNKASKYRRLKYFFVGYSLNNAGKRIYLSYFKDDKKLSYGSVGLGYGINIKKNLFFEISGNLIPKTFPNNKVDNLVTFNLGVKFSPISLVL